MCYLINDVSASPFRTLYLGVLWFIREAIRYLRLIIFQRIGFAFVGAYDIQPFFPAVVYGFGNDIKAVDFFDVEQNWRGFAIGCFVFGTAGNFTLAVSREADVVVVAYDKPDPRDVVLCQSLSGRLRLLRRACSLCVLWRCP